MTAHLQLLGLAAVLVFAEACAGTSRPTPPSLTKRGAGGAAARGPERAADAATSMVGSPYRHGGSTPGGFDCSGLVVYSFARAGLAGLPHSAEALERRARKVPMDELRPGDLLFFRLDGKKTSHVGIYVGDESFVHAPSGGKRVERVSFDDVYWGPRLGRAGRIGF